MLWYFVVEILTTDIFNYTNSQFANWATMFIEINKVVELGLCVITLLVRCSCKKWLQTFIQG